MNANAEHLRLADLIGMYSSGPYSSIEIRCRSNPELGLMKIENNTKDIIKELQQSYDQKRTGKRSGGSRPPSRINADDGAPITLVFVNATDKEQSHNVTTQSSMALKHVFNEYADAQGISIRSLRFSHAGNTLFLSNVGKKTVKEMGFKCHDEILVHDTASGSATKGGLREERNAAKTRRGEDQDFTELHDIDKPRKSRDDDSSSSHGNKNSKATRSKKTKDKQKWQKHQEECRAKTLEEHKVEHSKRLDKIHDEVQVQFKQIRQRLNNLVIKRSRRKVKSKCQRSPKQEHSLPSRANNPPEGGLGGKAGKSRYEIQVGEVQNLYKTTKPSYAMARDALSLPSLDLHGCTRYEALAKLDESLEIWTDAAMRGSYPFVQPAVIVCGCGNQILSEAVQDWIRSNDKVSNMPKARSSKKMMV